MALFKVGLRFTLHRKTVLVEVVFGSAEVCSQHPPEGSLYVILIHYYLRGCFLLSGRNYSCVVKVVVLLLLYLWL